MRLVLLLMVGIATLSNTYGVNARRHDGRPGRGKHRRGANLSETTPATQNNTEVVAQVGGTATIKCYTTFLGDEVVTWMKRDEDQLLTAGRQVYSSETRYSVAHVRHQRLWELSLRDVRQSDAGVYECQVTTHPPTSLFFLLKVVEARAVIQGAPEVHAHTGSRLRLHCGLEHATQTPTYIFWFHNNTMVNYMPRRELRVVRHHYGSSLVIPDVNWNDAGDYRCEPQMAHPANVTLHIVAEEKHAALHNGHGGDESEQLPAAGSSPSSTTPLLIGSCLFILLMDADASR
ncbi:lachesin-like [Panulirus ornatus]|uniref:lachesin-like n=1 Tax=Panulirus ornatus TaxID=150431 RepID=UPI003A838CE8